MKRILIISTLSVSWIALLLPGIEADESEIPPRAAELLAKLTDWENDRKKELAQEIATKREEVIKLLERELQDATRKGDLDGALNIRNSIKGLRNSGPDSAKQNAKPSTPNPVPNEFDPTDTKWIGTRGIMKGQVFEFNQGGAMVSTRQDGKSYSGWRWKIDEKGGFFLRISGTENEYRRAEVSADGGTFKYSRSNDEKETTFEKAE